MAERGASEEEVRETIKLGEKFPAKYGRIGFRRNFSLDRATKKGRYRTKQVEVFGVEEGGDFVAVTIIVKYF